MGPDAARALMVLAVVVLGLGLAFSVVIIYCACALSSKISRREERSERD